MNLTIKIENLPYLPLNRARTVARNMLIKTPLAREFEKDLASRIQVQDTKGFKDLFFSGNNFLEVTYNIYAPKELLLKKDGTISNRACDTDSIKLLQDTIFKEIDIDDKFIRHLHVISRPSYNEYWNYLIELKIKGIKELI